MNTLTPRTARIINKITKNVMMCCVTLGFVSFALAAGTSDFYTEIKMPVPGYTDVKLGIIAIALMIVVFLCVKIMNREELDVMYDLNAVPLYCTCSIDNAMVENKVFCNQVNAAIEKFYGYDWGDLSEWDIEANDKAVNNGEGRISAMYKTILGKVYIITEEDRSATTVLFSDEY